MHPATVAPGPVRLEGRMWRQRGAIYVLLAMALAAAWACGGDGTGPGDGDGEIEAGRFTARITGGFTQTLSGFARYFEGDDRFAIAMTSDAPGARGIGLGLTRGNRSRPEVGEYRVIEGGVDLPEDDFVSFLYLDSSEDPNGCQSGDLDNPGGDAGTVNITASRYNVVGEFTFEIWCGDPNSGVVMAATITGEFNAKSAK
jgi:hypothetical protein